MNSDRLLKRRRTSALMRIFGLAAINQDFLKKLQDNPLDALIDANIEPIEDILNILEHLNYSPLVDFNNQIASYREVVNLNNLLVLLSACRFQ